ncbi:hypothetical protein CTAYLR_001401 [Chrysophaeum taylorii]|uniref:Cyclic nucleotide-binding domain-containing protein n=1 Tax=Chrysophaeum taylorii TaxID=2483200 RepID=A0AAD7XLG8_9STRA|nr:hypothetical protein CTAYLR_001401 [Chrysophaeum taylorii]
MSQPAHESIYAIALMVTCMLAIFSLGPRLAFGRGNSLRDPMLEVLFWLQQASSVVFMIIYLPGAYVLHQTRRQEQRVHAEVQKRLKSSDSPLTARKASRIFQRVLETGVPRSLELHHPMHLWVQVGAACILPIACDMLSLVRKWRRIKWVGCLRLLHLCGFRRLFSVLEANLVIPHYVPPMLRNVLLLTFVTHHAACGLWLTARARDFSATSWVGYHRPDIIDSSANTQYVTSCYFAVATLSTVGYGDIYPVNISECTFVMTYVFINIFLLANIVGDISALAAMKDTDLAAKRNRISRFERMLDRERISADVASATLEYLRLGLSMPDVEIDMNSLPASVRVRIREERFGVILRSLPLFRGLSARFIGRCVARVVEDAYVKDQDLVRRGDMASRLCVIVDGIASIEMVPDQGADEGTGRGTLSTTDDSLSWRADDDSRSCSVALLQPGAVFGAESFVCKMHEPWTVVGRTLLRVISLDENDSRDFEQSFPTDWFRLRRNLHESIVQMRDATQQLADSLNLSNAETAPTNHVKLSKLNMSLELPSTLKYPSCMGTFSQIAAEVASNIVRVTDKASHSLASTFCHYASAGDDFELRHLLATVSIKDVGADYDGRTPLHLSAACGHVDCTRTLIEAGAPTSPCDRFGRTPLVEAVRAGHAEVIAFLRAHGGKLSLPEHELGQILCHAAHEGDIVLIRNFLDAGANPNAVDYDNRSALMLAASAGNVAICRYLLERGADPLAKDRWGHVAADEAVSNGHTGALYDLLVDKANWRVENGCDDENSYASSWRQWRRRRRR